MEERYIDYYHSQHKHVPFLSHPIWNGVSAYFNKKIEIYDKQNHIPVGWSGSTRKCGFKLDSGTVFNEHWLHNVSGRC